MGEGWTKKWEMAGYLCCTVVAYVMKAAGFVGRLVACTYLMRPRRKPKVGKAKALLWGAPLRFQRWDTEDPPQSSISVTLTCVIVGLGIEIIFDVRLV